MNSILIKYDEKEIPLEDIKIGGRFIFNYRYEPNTIEAIKTDISENDLINCVNLITGESYDLDYIHLVKPIK